MKDLGSLSFFLGIHAQNLTNGMLLSKSKYTLDLLSRFKMIDAKTPIPARSQLFEHHGDPLQNATEYRQLVGALQYLTLTKTKHNLHSQPVMSVYAQSHNCPLDSSQESMKRPQRLTQPWIVIHQRLIHSQCLLGTQMTEGQQLAMPYILPLFNQLEC
ncbi:hypothetical protein F2P56_031000 [Juglans regia]|uniref:Uncharacterized mitochondrial protein AtMg00810-like n=2 Tax=Juglans regia TaxID=51240 RepID=A0A2I4GTR1_JUGRE|nr:uncharacterized mitochondrial protein AtMg00810-like [Juglans regia]KAF5450670.1 hypothetical protein F2P56_031000 [Juglans regia]